MQVDPQFYQHLLDIQRRFKNKEQLLKYFRLYIYLYMPSDTHCTLHFLQQVVTGRKRCLTQLECKYIKVPILPELSVGRIWRDAIRIPGFLDFMPDEWEGGRRVDRKFFWMVLTTQHPEWVKHLIKGSREARNRHREEMKIPQQLLQPAPEWIDHLLRDEGYVPAPGRRTGPSFLIERQMRPRQQARAPLIINHGVDVGQYVQALNEHQQEQAAANQNNVVDDFPPGMMQPPLAVRPTAVQSQLGEQPEFDLQSRQGAANQLNGDIFSVNDDFASAQGDLVRGRPSNVPMLGGLGHPRDEDFRSAHSSR